MTMLKSVREILYSFSNELMEMEKLDLENEVDCSKPCTQTLYNVDFKSDLSGDFDESWITIAFSDQIQE